MPVISKKLLQQFWPTHADSKDALTAWYSIAKRAEWRNLEEIRQTYPFADAVDRWTVFNIQGNRYRLATTIHYNRQIY